MARRNHSRTSRPQETLSPELLDLTPAETVDMAQTWWQDQHLLDDLDIHLLRQDLTQFLTACQSLDLTSNAAVLASLPSVIAQTSGINTSQFLSTAESHQQFRNRNHIGAALAAAALQFDNSPKLVLDELPTQHPRAGGVHRPCTDDEILLLRQRTLHSIAQGGRSLLAGFQYMLVESGALPVEAALVQPNDLDDIRHPTRVDLPGVTHHHARSISLPRWAQAPFITAMDTHLANCADAAERALCYVGQSGAPATVSASASAMLRRTMIAAGLTEDFVPKSVVKWRVQRTLNTAGFGPTLAILGKQDAAQIHHFLVGHSRSKPKKSPRTNTPKRPTFLD